MANVLITGGGNGLGHELALLFHGKGHSVTVVDVKESRPLPFAEFIKIDLARVDEKVIEKFSEEFDVVVCNAGISLSGDFVDHTQFENNKVVQINLMGHMELIRQLLKQDKICDDGRIGFILSASVFLPWPVSLAYSASKSGLDGFAMALESYLKGSDISVTRIYPGPMKTDHAKYYEGISEGKGSDPKFIARKVYRGIMGRRVKVYPDRISRLIRFGSIFFPTVLSSMMFQKYKTVFSTYYSKK